MEHDTVVTTRTGKVHGAIEDDLVVFRGIPYAAPPVGPLRWRRPQQHETWLGVRTCTEFGPSAPQGDFFGGLSLDPEGPAPSEDCLTLNAWTPALDDARRPVLVFVHGGGFVSGGGSVVVYDGQHLARRGAVVVTFNYRLGALGFLGHPSLGDPLGGPGFANWGLADQIAALVWVRDHAAALGGDPENVTVFGESAGAISIVSLLASGEAAGLFRRAIVQSGADGTQTAEAAAKLAEQISSGLGLASPERAALERVPVAELLAAQHGAFGDIGEAAGLPFQPVVDGGVLTRPPLEALAAGASADVDLLIGTNRDEWKFFTFTTPGLSGIDEAKMAALVGGHLSSWAAASAGGIPGPTADEIIATYRAARSGRGEATEPLDLYAAVASDWIFRVPSARIAEAHASCGGRTFAYLFDWESALGHALGSCHALELPFVFGTLGQPMISMFTGAGPDADSALGPDPAGVAVVRPGRRPGDRRVGRMAGLRGRAPLDHAARPGPRTMRRPDGARARRDRPCARTDRRGWRDRERRRVTRRRRRPLVAPSGRDGGGVHSGT